jgi:aspartate-semialdehyde dehydrogenase
MHSHRTTERPTVAIVGGESLLGKEVRELLEAGKLPASIQSIASSDEGDDARILTREHDEATVMSPLHASDIASAKIVVLAASTDANKRAFEELRSLSPTAAIIDMSGGLEDHPATRLRAPMVEPPGHTATGEVQVIAHPASIALALFLTRLRKAGAISRSVAQVFEPASEFGQAGIGELQKQTVSLLSFKPIPKDLFDAQVSFNMLAAYGSDSPHSLEEIELKIDRHLASLLANGGLVPMPSLRLIQAPVFHGYSISIWVEFESNPGVDAIERALASEQIDVRKDQEPPTNVGVAGQDGIAVGGIVADRNNPRACWFWIVADNLRLAAENAVEVAREILD